MITYWPDFKGIETMCPTIWLFGPPDPCITYWPDFKGIETPNLQITAGPHQRITYWPDFKGIETVIY